MDYSKNSEDQNIQSSEDQNTQSSTNTPDISSNSSTLSNSNNFPPNFLRSSTNSLINADSPTNSSKNLGTDEFSRSTTKSNTFKDFFFRSRSFSQSNEGGSVKSFYSDESADPPINIPKVSERNKSLLFQFKPNYNSDDFDEENVAFQSNREQSNEELTNMVRKWIVSTYPSFKLTSRASYTLGLFIESILQSLINEIQCFHQTDSKDPFTDNEVKRAISRILGIDLSQEPLPVHLTPKNQLVASYFATGDKVSSDFFRLLSSNSWQKVKTKYDVLISISKDIDTKSDIQLMRGDGAIGVTPEQVKNVLSDHTNWSWDPLWNSSKLLEQLDNHTMVLHLKYIAEVCMLKRARDFVCITHWHQQKDGSYVLVARSVEYPDCPPTTECVRGQILTLGYLITPHPKNPNHSQVSYISHLDVKVVNERTKPIFFSLVQEKQPLNIAGIRKFLTGKLEYVP